MKKLKLRKFGREKRIFETNFKVTKLEQDPNDDDYSEFEANFARILNRRY